MPVFLDERRGEPVLVFVAARGHHADIGGITPGSMPPDSRTIHEEGVLIDNFLLVDEGRFREAEMRALLASGDWPARNPDRNIADLKAQLAACARGADELRAGRATITGADVIAAYMGHVQANAEESVRRLIGRLDDGAFDYEMDNGAHVRVAHPHRPRQPLGDRSISPAPARSSRTISTRPLAICPRGGALCLPHAWSTTTSRSTTAACGRSRSIVPEGSMLNPRLSRGGGRGKCRDQPGRHRRAVRRHRAAGAGQGTMNNFTFGNDRHQYYETIAGGSGAGPDLRRHRRRPDAHDQLPPHRPGNPGIALSGPARALCDPPRLGRRGRAPRRRRRRPRDPLPRADARQHPRQPPPRRAEGIARRRRCCSRAATGSNAPTAPSSSLARPACADVRPGDRFIIETPGGAGFGRAE